MLGSGVLELCVANIRAHVERQHVAVRDGIMLSYIPTGVVRLPVLFIKKNPSHLNYDMRVVLTNDGSRVVSAAVTCARGVSITAACARS